VLSDAAEKVIALYRDLVESNCEPIYQLGLGRTCKLFWRRAMLKSLLLHLAEAAWRARIAKFWPIWITIVVAAAICVAWVVGQAPTPTVPEAEKVSIIRAPRYVWS
jgi:hypothetical protein